MSQRREPIMISYESGLSVHNNLFFMHCLQHTLKGGVERKAGAARRRRKTRATLP